MRLTTEGKLIVAPIFLLFCGSVVEDRSYEVQLAITISISDHGLEKLRQTDRTAPPLLS